MILDDVYGPEDEAFSLADADADLDPPELEWDESDAQELAATLAGGRGWSD